MDIKGVDHIHAQSVGSRGSGEKPPSADIIVTVLAEISIDFGNIVKGTPINSEQIDALMSKLQTIPQSDPNYQAAQNMISDLQDVQDGNEVRGLMRAFASGQDLLAESENLLTPEERKAFSRQLPTRRMRLANCLNFL